MRTTGALFALALLALLMLDAWPLSPRADGALATRITLDVPSTMYAGTGMNMTASLTDLAGARIPGWLTWYLNGAELGAGAGTGMSLQGWPKTPGTYAVTVTFNGTADYLPTQAQATFVVLEVPASYTVTLTAPPSLSQPAESQSSASQASPVVVVQQVDTIPIALAIIISGMIIASGIVIAAKARRSTPS